MNLLSASIVVLGLLTAVRGGSRQDADTLQPAREPHGPQPGLTLHAKDMPSGRTEVRLEASLVSSVAVDGWALLLIDVSASRDTGEIIYVPTRRFVQVNLHWNGADAYTGSFSRPLIPRMAGQGALHEAFIVPALDTDISKNGSVLHVYVSFEQGVEMSALDLALARVGSIDMDLFDPGAMIRFIQAASSASDRDVLLCVQRHLDATSGALDRNWCWVQSYSRGECCIAEKQRLFNSDFRTGLMILALFAAIDPAHSERTFWPRDSRAERIATAAGGYPMFFACGIPFSLFDYHRDSRNMLQDADFVDAIISSGAALSRPSWPHTEPSASDVVAAIERVAASLDEQGLMSGKEVKATLLHQYARYLSVDRL